MYLCVHVCTGGLYSRHHDFRSRNYSVSSRPLERVCDFFVVVFYRSGVCNAGHIAECLPAQMRDRPRCRRWASALTHLHTYTDTHTDTHAHTRTNTHTHTHTHAQTHTQTHKHTQIQTNQYIYTYISTCDHRCAYKNCTRTSVHFIGAPIVSTSADLAGLLVLCVVSGLILGGDSSEAEALDVPTNISAL